MSEAMRLQMTSLRTDRAVIQSEMLELLSEMEDYRLLMGPSLRLETRLLCLDIGLFKSEIFMLRLEIVSLILDATDFQLEPATSRLDDALIHLETAVFRVVDAASRLVATVRRLETIEQLSMESSEEYSLESNEELGLEIAGLPSLLRSAFQLMCHALQIFTVVQYCRCNVGVIVRKFM